MQYATNLSKGRHSISRKIFPWAAFWFLNDIICSKSFTETDIQLQERFSPRSALWFLQDVMCSKFCTKKRRYIILKKVCLSCEFLTHIVLGKMLNQQFKDSPMSLHSLHNDYIVKKQNLYHANKDFSALIRCLHWLEFSSSEEMYILLVIDLTIRETLYIIKLTCALNLKIESRLMQWGINHEYQEISTY